jgi:hypothetical protein
LDVASQQPHFGLRRQSVAATALFHGGVILGRIERQSIREGPRSRPKKSGVALRLPPHSKKHHCDETQA